MVKAVTAEIVTTRGALSAREAQQLTAAEADVEKGGSLIVAAMELIRDQRLYRATHETFEDYCRERWSRTARSVNQLIQAEAVVQAVAAKMGTNGSQISHRAAREVADLPTEEAVEVVKKASENNGKPTAKAVREAREEVEAKPRKVSGGTTFNVDELEDQPRNAAGKSQEQESPTPMLDTLNREVPKGLAAEASAAAALSAIGRKLDPLKRELEGLAQTSGGRFVDMTDANRLFRELKNCITQARYWTACPRCDGKGCERCSMSGWIPFSKRGQLSADDKAALGVE